MNNPIFLYLLLGLLAALATVINNMFSPAMPSMVAFFKSSQEVVQGGFAAGMIGLSIGTLLWGTLSDMLGRRRPLLVSMTLFVISSACILPVTDVRLFVALRFVQGFTAAGGIAISRSVATDSFTERRLLKAMAVINIVNGVMPIVAPMVGGAMVGLAGWHGVFAVILGVGILLAGGCFMFRESLPADRRNNRTFSAIFGGFKAVLTNRRYMSMLLHQATAEILLFGNLASCAFVAQYYGWADYIGLFLALNGVFIGIGAGVSGALPSALRGVRICFSGILAMSVVVAVVLLCDWGFIAYEIAVCLMLGFMGMTLTSSTALAMESARDHAGTASSLFVASGFLMGGVISYLMSMGDMLFTTAIIFVSGAVLSTLFALLYKNEKK